MHFFQLPLFSGKCKLIFLYLMHPLSSHRQVFDPCKYLLKTVLRGFPGGPLVKNPPWDVGDTGSIPGWRTGIPHAEEQLSPCAAITGAFMPPLESLCPKQRSHMMQWRSDTGKSINIFLKNLTYYEKWYLFFKNVNFQFITVSYWFRTFIEPLRK